MGEISRIDIAYQYLYSSIVKNEIKAGEPIIEQEISNKIGVSRTPIREALKRLEADGLIRHIPQRGKFVNEITEQDIEEIFVLRETLEKLALQKSIIRIPSESIESLEIELEKLTNDSSYEKFYESDRKLHELIVKFGNNKRLDEILSKLNAQIEMLRIVSSMKPKRLEKSKEEHIKIIKALKSRNFEKTSQLLSEHIINIKNSVLEVYELNRML